MITLTS